jgi:AraC-like DNA-binding protein
MHYVTMLKGEIQYYNMLSVGQVQLYLDGLMQQASSISEDLVGAPYISKILKSQSRENSGPYDLYQAQQEMANIFSGHENFEEMMLYIPSFDLLVSNNTYADNKVYYDAYLKGASLNYSQYFSLISAKYISPKFVDFTFVTQGGGVANKTLLIKPLKLIPRGQIYSNVIFLLDRDKMHTETSRNIIVFDENRLDIIYYNNRIPFDLKDIEKATELNNNAVFEKVIGDECYMFATAHSTVQNWTYIIYADKKTFLAKAMLIQRTFYLCLVICFFTGIAIVLTLTKKSYKRVDTVLKIFEDKPFEGKGDELLYIGNSIVRIQDEKRKQTQLFQGQLILSLIEKQDSQKLPDKHLLASNGIAFTSNYFFVVVFKEKEVNEEILKSILEICRETETNGYFFKSGPFTGFLFNTPERQIEEAYGIVSSTITMVKERFSLTIVSSDLNYTYLYLSRAFTQALDVLDFSLRSSATPSPIFYRDMIKIVKGQSFEYPVETELAISDALKKGDEECVLRTISTIIDANIIKEVTPQALRFLMVNIAGTVIKVFSRLDEKLFSSYPEINLHPILQTSSIAQVRTDLEVVIHQICDVLSRKVITIQDQKDLALYNLVIAYIEEHYNDKNMSVTSIAEEMNLSAVNLSRLFKKNNRQLISDYINSVRIEQAKKLLKDDEYLDVVSEKCGFGSLRTFMRVFKNQEAMTPGNYKGFIKTERKDW